MAGPGPKGPGLVRRLGVILAVVALVAPSVAHARGNPQIAGLQVALRAHGLYLAQIDGIAGPRTAAAVHAFQPRAVVSHTERTT